VRVEQEGRTQGSKGIRNNGTITRAGGVGEGDTLALTVESVGVSARQEEDLESKCLGEATNQEAVGLGRVTGGPTNGGQKRGSEIGWHPAENPRDKGQWGERAD